MHDKLIDRRDLPIFIHSAIDDLGLTPRAFRVYAHLARRADKSGAAWPSYAAMGQTCFEAEFYAAGKPVNLETCRTWAIRAVAELEERGLLRKFQRNTEAGDQTSNGYELTPQSAWVARGVTRDHPETPKGGDPGSLPGDPGSPKGTPGKVLQLKGEAPGRPPRGDSRSAGEQASAGLRELNAKLDARTRRALTDALLSETGLLALANQNDDNGERALRQAQEDAITLHGMGLTEPRHIAALAASWRTQTWQGRKGDTPTRGQLLAYASQQQATQTAAPAISEEGPAIPETFPGMEAA